MVMPTVVILRLISSALPDNFTMMVPPDASRGFGAAIACSMTRAPFAIVSGVVVELGPTVSIAKGVIVEVSVTVGVKVKVLLAGTSVEVGVAVRVATGVFTGVCVAGGGVSVSTAVVVRAHVLFVEGEV